LTSKNPSTIFNPRAVNFINWSSPKLVYIPGMGVYQTQQCYVGRGQNYACTCSHLLL